MKIKNIVVVSLLLVALCGISSATVIRENSGNMAYPADAWAYISINQYGTSTQMTDTYDTQGHEIRVIATRTGNGSATITPIMLRGSSQTTWTYLGGTPYALDYTYGVSASNLLSAGTSHSSPSDPKAILIYFIPNETGLNTISGDIACISSVELQGKNVSGGYFTLETDDSGGSTYSFDIGNNTDYKLLFSGGAYYEFTSNGSDLVYDLNVCTHTYYRFEEMCGNLIPSSEGFYIEKIGSTVHAANDFYTASGTLDITMSPANNIYISATPFSGEAGWFLDPITNDTTYNLTNNFINWGLKVVVKNGTDDTLIEDAVVKVGQTCYCTGGNSVRQKKTVNGTVSYNDMSLQDASLWVYATGYKILDENTTGYNVFLSGRSNLSSKTWIVEMAPNSGNETSDWHETAHTTDVHFKDVDGNVTSKILDTDAYVRLYYQNNNSQGDSMTLKFQSSSTHTYFIDEQSWNIPHDESGYKEIVTSYFTPWDYSYRATMYNSSIYGWNITIPLTVRNAVKETEQHYENLSTYLWFLNSDDGKIDYREDMDVVVHACSNNTTLMNIDVEVHKDGALLCYKNLTATDFITADFPYYYVYEPQYSYVSGSNYSVRMYGFDRTLLETAYVDCMTDTIVRKNRLTIHVKDRAGTPLTQAYIFLEDWGSLPTEALSYNAYEGVPDGTYQYKASKSGYSAVGWSIINMSGSDETVTYTLTSDVSGEALSSEKMTDDDIKAIFYPCMFFLLIIILIGGLMHVSR